MTDPASPYRTLQKLTRETGKLAARAEAAAYKCERGEQSDDELTKLVERMHTTATQAAEALEGLA